LTVGRRFPRSAPYRGIGSEIVRGVGQAWLRAFGWTVIGDWPGVPKAVLVAAPHTSNWDGLHMLAGAAHYRIKLRWMGKASLARGPLGGLMMRAGLVPVERAEALDQVAQAARAIRAADDMILAVAPEGTRAFAEAWKTGFYHIAAEAGVPLIMAILDYGKRTITLTPPLDLTGDKDADIQAVKSVYAGVVPKKPENWQPVD